MLTSEPAAVSAAASPPGLKRDRVISVDLVRGIACVLMAIDHVRVYAGVPTGGPPDIFLTRWVTHFVAPIFCFFAGTGAYFMGRRLEPGAVRRFLVTRGLLLVVLEFTVIRFLWSANVGTEFMLAGVIWMLGWCMVLLAPFVGMPATRVGWIGVGIVVLQHIFGLLPSLLPGAAGAAVAPWWSFLYPADAEAPFGINVLYVIVPWIGVMAAGFGFGRLMELDDARRRRTLIRLGVGMTAVFLAVATALAWGAGGGDAEGASPPFWMRILDQRKYPASQLFLLMTLGPAIALLPFVEQARGFVARAFVMFGRVPMWYYLMHLLVIHSAALIVTWVRTGAMHHEWYSTAPYTNVPSEGRWSLSMLYLVWAVCLVMLYPICQWYATRKANRPYRWMRYL